MDEHDRLLAEGPRVAPEPESAEPAAPVVPAPRRPRQSQQIPARMLWRLVPLGVFAVVLIANGRGSGHYAFAVFAAIIAVSAIVRMIRRRRG